MEQEKTTNSKYHAKPQIVDIMFYETSALKLSNKKVDI